MIPFIWHSGKDKTIGKENRIVAASSQEQEEGWTLKAQHKGIGRVEETVLDLDCGPHQVFVYVCQKLWNLTECVLFYANYALTETVEGSYQLNSKLDKVSSTCCYPFLCPSNIFCYTGYNVGTHGLLLKELSLMKEKDM